jgi:hypothetical protein
MARVAKAQKKPLNIPPGVKAPAVKPVPPPEAKPLDITQVLAAIAECRVK